MLLRTTSAPRSLTFGDADLWTAVSAPMPLPDRRLRKIKVNRSSPSSTIMLSIARALAILVFALFSAAMAAPVPKSVDVRVEELKAKVDEMTLAANSKEVSEQVEAARSYYLWVLLSRDAFVSRLHTRGSPRARAGEQFVRSRAATWSMHAACV